MITPLLASVCALATMTPPVRCCPATSAGLGADARAAAKAPTLERVSIEAAAFLAGDWSAARPGREGTSGLTQEIWSAPAGDNMLGMFRWLGADGSARVFELLTITEEDETLVLRLRHQDARGSAWEEQDRPATLHLAEHAGTRVVFVDSSESCDLAACVYECPSPDRLTITVKFDDPTRADLVFPLARSGTVPASSSAGATTESAPGASSPLTGAEARAVFDRFASLDGEWIGRSTKGWEDRIIYQTVAAGSVVVERSFDAHPGEQMYTMVHMDGDRLMLTHYCVARNQPRLVCTAWDDAAAAATFEFLDATGLESRDAGHMDKVVVRFVDDAHFAAQWTWYQDGQESWMEEILHERAGE